MTINRPVGLFVQGNNTGENDGQMTMVFHGHTTMVDHGFAKWPSMVQDHGQPLGDHGQRTKK